MKLFQKPIALLTALSLSMTALLSGCSLFVPSTYPEEPLTTEAASAVPTTAPPVTTAATDPTKAKDAPTPLLWKVTGDKGNVMYLFGTIHLGDKRSETVLQQLSDKVDACDALAVECDVVAFEEDEKRLSKVVQSMLYTDGTKVSDHMRADLYPKAVDYLTKAGSYNDLYNYYNLSFWSSFLQQTEMENGNLDSEYAMDTLLLHRAKDRGQEILEVESVESQYEMDNNFPDDLHNMQIEAFFDELDDYNSNLSKLYEAWIKGDESQITAILDEEDGDDMTEEEQKLAEDYHKVMIIDRNNGMAEKADGYLKSGKSVFFAVGEAHMLGDEGIVRQLTDKGYKVEKLSP